MGEEGEEEGEEISSWRSITASLRVTRRTLLPEGEEKGKRERKRRGRERETEGERGRGRRREREGEGEREGAREGDRGRIKQGEKVGKELEHHPIHSGGMWGQPAAVAASRTVSIRETSSLLYCSPSFSCVREIM